MDSSKPGSKEDTESQPPSSPGMTETLVAANQVESNLDQHSETSDTAVKKADEGSKESSESAQADKQDVPTQDEEKTSMKTTGENDSLPTADNPLNELPPQESSEMSADSDTDKQDISRQDKVNSSKTIAESESQPTADDSPSKLPPQESSEMSERSTASDIDKQDASRQDEVNSSKTIAESESQPTADVSPSKLPPQESSEMSERSTASDIDKQDASRQDEVNSSKTIAESESQPTADVSSSKLKQQKSSEMSAAPDINNQDTSTKDKENSSKTSGENESQPTADVSPNRVAPKESSEMSERSAAPDMDKQETSAQDEGNSSKTIAESESHVTANVSPNKLTPQESSEISATSDTDKQDSSKQDQEKSSKTIGESKSNPTEDASPNILTPQEVPEQDSTAQSQGSEAKNSASTTDDTNEAAEKQETSEAEKLQRGENDNLSIQGSPCEEEKASSGTSQQETSLTTVADTESATEGKSGSSPNKSTEANKDTEQHPSSAPDSSTIRKLKNLVENVKGASGTAKQARSVKKAPIPTGIIKVLPALPSTSMATLTKVGTSGTAPQVATVGKAQTLTSIVKPTVQGGKATAPLSFVQIGGKVYQVNQGGTVGTAPQAARVQTSAQQAVQVQTPVTGQQVATSGKAHIMQSILKPTGQAGKAAPLSYVRIGGKLYQMNPSATAQTSGTPAQVATVQTLGVAPQVAVSKTVGVVPLAGTLRTSGTQPQVVPMQTLGTLPQVATVQSLGNAPQITAVPTLYTVPSVGTVQKPGTSPLAAVMQTLGNAPRVATMQTLGSQPQVATVQTSGTSPQVATVQTLGTSPQVATLQTLGSQPQVATVQTSGTSPQVATVQTLGTAPSVATVQTPGTVPQVTTVGKTQTVPSVVKASGQVANAPPLTYVRLKGKLYPVKSVRIKEISATGNKTTAQVTGTSPALGQGTIKPTIMKKTLALIEGKEETDKPTLVPIKHTTDVTQPRIGGILESVLGQPAKPGQKSQTATLGTPGNVAKMPTKEGEVHVEESVDKQYNLRPKKHSARKTQTMDDDSESSDDVMAPADHDHGYSQHDSAVSGKKKGKSRRRNNPRYYHRCIVEGCDNNRAAFPDLKFFRFPWKHKARFTKWAENIGRPEFIEERNRPSVRRKEFGRVCEVHFESKYVGWKQLKPDAVPTLLLDGSDIAQRRNEKSAGDRPKEKSTGEQRTEKILTGPGVWNRSETKIKPGVLSSLEEKGENDKPVFLKPLKDYTTQRGSEDVVLQCLINLDVADVIWYRNGEEIVPCKHFRVRFDVKPARVKQSILSLFKIGVTSLTIIEPRAQDSGLYMCRATGGNGKFSVSCAYVTVLGSDHLQSPYSFAIYHGYADNGPAVECKKCQLKTNTADTGSTIFDDVIPQMKQDLLNDVSVLSSAAASSNQSKAPKFVMKLKNTTTKLGTALILRCMLDDTEAKTWWYRNGKRLAVCKHYDTLLSTTLLRRYAVLRVLNTTEEDLGVYTCVVIGKSKRAASTSCTVSCKEEDITSDSASDNVSKDAKECKKCTREIHPPEAPLVHDEVFQRLQKELDKIQTLSLPVRKKSDPPKFIKGLGNATVKYGDRLVLTAMIDDPYASISWYHNDTILGTCKHTEMVLSTSSKRRYAVLRINPAIESDTGTYTCMAEGESIRTNVKRKSVTSQCIVEVQGTYLDGMAGYNEMACWKCVGDPTSQRHQREVLYTRAAREARKKNQTPAKKPEEQEPPLVEQTLPTIQSAWSVSTAAPAEFSTPVKKSRKRAAAEMDVEERKSKKRAASEMDDDIPPPPPDTPPRSPSPPLPTYDNNIAPLFVKKLVDRQYVRNLGSRASVLLLCAVNVQSAKHEWFHNGKKIQPCKDNNITRVVDQQNINQVIASMEINNLNRSDNGVYTCVASNDKGSISTSCFVGSNSQAHTMSNWPVLECEKCKFDSRKSRNTKLKNEQKIAKQEAMDTKDTPSTSGTDTQQQVQSGAEKSKGDKESSNVDQAQSENSGEKDKSPAKSSDGKDQAQSESSGEKDQSAAESSGVKDQAQPESAGGKEQSTTESSGGKDQAQSESSSGKDKSPTESSGQKDQAQSKSSSGKDQSPVESVGEKETGATATVESSQKTQPQGILSVTKELTGVKSVSNRTITLKCQFSHTVPTIKWFYMGYEIKECTHYQQLTKIVGGEANFSLRMSKLMPVDMGIYTCLAWTGNDQFVSTSCNLTASAKPQHMNKYLKSCKKCITRKAARMEAYEAEVKRRKLMKKLEEEKKGDVSAQPVLLETGQSLPRVINRPLPPVANRPLPPVITGLIPATTNQLVPTMIYQPVIAMTNQPLPAVTNRLVPTMTNQPLPAVTNGVQMQANKHHAGKLETASAKSKGRGYVQLRVSDSFHADKHLVEERKKREQMILNTNANLRRKVRKYQQIVRRQNEKFEKLQKGEKVFKKDRRHRSTQTLKDSDPVAELKKLEYRYKEVHTKYASVNGRLGCALKEVSKLQNMVKSVQEKNKETVTQLKNRVAELEEGLQRRDGSSIGRQLQSRGKDPSAYAGFIQYMTDD